MNHYIYVFTGSERMFYMTDITDMPRAGFFCIGRDPYSLSLSVRTSCKIEKFLGENGFVSGAFYTEITQNPQKSAVRSEQILGHICSCCELALTFGGTGYSVSDIIPDVTEKICRPAPDCISSALAPRGQAGIFGKTLVLNLPNDFEIALNTLERLMTAVCFSVLGLSGKSALSAVELKNSLNSSIDFHNFFKKKCIVNI